MTLVTGYKLLLLGHIKSEAEPWPIVLPGEAKPLSSTKVGEYVNDELFYYAEFYSNFKHAGPPFSGGWAEWPQWCLQIIRAFDDTFEEVRAWRQEKAYREQARSLRRGRFKFKNQCKL